MRVHEVVDLRCGSPPLSGDVSTLEWNTESQRKQMLPHERYMVSSYGANQVIGRDGQPLPQGARITGPDDLQGEHGSERVRYLHRLLHHVLLIENYDHKPEAR
jgi:hypothetical protein